MEMHCWKIPIKISYVWIPYIILMHKFHIYKIVIYIFTILTIHEMAHILIARLFHYPIDEIIIYPFGLSAQISYIGFGNLIQEVMIICAGPLMHVFIPYFLQLWNQQGFISNTFLSYLLQMNVSIFIFNILPIYPLDGGRLLQTFFHCFLPFTIANKLTYIVSGVMLMLCLTAFKMNTVGIWFVCIFIMFQLILAYKNIWNKTLQFYYYRYQHPITSPIYVHDKNDLYRGCFNILRKFNFVDEHTWLETHFFKNKGMR